MMLFVRRQGEASSFRPQSILTLTAPITRSVKQRAANNTASITITGTYVLGTPTSIEARAVVINGGVAVGWTAIATPSNGAFSGTLSVTGGWYTIEVRSKDGSSVTGSASVTKVGVGDIFIIAGQSNAANYGAAVQTPADDRVQSRSLAGTWALGTDPQPSAGNTLGSPWPAFGDALAATTNCPVAFLSVGQGGSSVAQWAPGQTNYDTKLKPALQLFPANGFRAVLWHQGETDSTGVTTQNQYQTSLRSIITQSRTDAGWTVPWGIARTATFNDSSGGTATNAAPIQAAQTAVAADANNFAGANTDTITSVTYRYDGVHMTVTGLTTHGQRWSAAVISAFSL